MGADVLRVPRERALDLLSAFVLEQQSEDRLAPVTVIAPSARAAVGLGRRLIEARRASSPGEAAGFANVNFVTLARLAEALGSLALEASGRRRLTRTTLAGAVRSALRARPGLFGASTGHPATASEVTERYEELRFAGALRASADAPLGLSARARELLRCCLDVRRQLASLTYDDVDLFESAIDALASSGMPELGAVALYLPERARPIELGFVTALALHFPVRAFVAEVGEAESDSPAELLAAALARALGVASPTARAGRAAQPDELLLAANPRTEVRAALRLALAQLEAGSDPERIALLYAARDPYLRLLAAELAAAGVAYSAPSPNPLAAEVPGRVLLAALELSGRTMRRDALVRLLRAAPLRAPDGSSVPVAEWDRVTRLVGIVEGTPREWAMRLGELVSREDAAFEEASASLEGGEAVHGREAARSREARAAAGLAHFVTRLDELFGAARTAHGWRELAVWAELCLVELLGASAADGNWPTATGAAFESTVALLRELATLDEVEPNVTLAELTAHLAEELRRPGPKVGGLGRGVVVGPLEELIGVETDLTVLLGATASNLPAPIGKSPLLEGADREQLGLDPLSPSAGGTRARRQLGLVRGASTRLVATAPMLDSSGRQVVASYLLAGAASVEALPGEFETLLGVRSGSLARHAAELELAVLLGAAPSGTATLARDHGLVELASRLEIVAVRERGEFGPYAGLVGPSAHALGESVFSPTSLETIAICPFRHFLDHVLACEALDEPERRLELDPRDRGSIVHEVLERYIGEQIAAPLLAEEARATRLREMAEEVIRRYQHFGRTGKRVVFELERRRILEGLEAERLFDEEMRAERGEQPIAVEHAFGFEPVPPVVVQAGNRTLSFRGRIDRIDRARDGSITVIDYKTGWPGAFVGIESDPIDGGRHLQLPIYALAARAHLDAPSAPVRAAFRFVGPVPSEVALLLDEPVQQRLEDALRVLSETVESGVFPMRPGAPGFGGSTNCRYCDFDALCPPDRQRFADAAASSGRLESYLTLTVGGDEAPAAQPALGATRS